MNKLAVLISDIHFSVNNLQLASESLKAAIDKSNELKVPLIVAGDLNDSKAIIRAEVANRLIELFGLAKQEIFILVGNHDLINEKGIGHGLNYLWPYAKIVDKPVLIDQGLTLVPYYSDLEALKTLLKMLRPEYPLIMHQGFRGAFMGDYIQDKTSIEISEVKDYRVFSGHYHRHQTLGTVTYIGSPYTITFGEANDGPKGFISINSDGTFERHILHLRKHITIELEAATAFNPSFESPLYYLKPEDLLWIKLKGAKSLLDAINKKQIAEKIVGHMNFKLEKIITENEDKPSETIISLTDKQQFDALIDSLEDTEAHKQNLKVLWRRIAT